MSNNDIVAKNIRKQLALNSGQLTITPTGGSYGFSSTTGGLLPPSTNASNYVLSNVPSQYRAKVRTEVYNYAKGVFSGQAIPEALLESLASLATYYVSQTGAPVQSLFQDGKFQANFLATINGFLNNTLQLGYQSLNTDQPWVNNPTLHGNVAAALQPSLR